MAEIVAFLQNQWVRDPARVKALYARHPGKREYLNASLLFQGSLTGRRLQWAFGDLCDEIIWEEVSTQIGGKSNSVFPPEPDHIRRVLEKHTPQIVLLFGRVAEEGVKPLWGGPTVVYPHPACRTMTDVALGDWLKMLEAARVSQEAKPTP